MSTRSLVEGFRRWAADRETLVLVTVVETAGSTYSKTGRQLLMRADGRHIGLVSGGCLEGDLLNHVREVMAGGDARLVSYDMRDDADDLWGIGLGCNGLMRLLLQPLTPADNYSPMPAIATALEDIHSHTITLIYKGDERHLPGECRIDARDRPADTSVELRVARWQTQPWVRLLVLGAAPDAVPVVNLARSLGWEVTIADHRPAYLERNDLTAADQALHVDPAELAGAVDLSGFHAILVMSHHLETDGKYLQQLADTNAVYTGLLGPLARKEKLLERIAPTVEPDSDFARRLRGPVGLEIGADSPESIALAVVAEIQTTMQGASPHTNGQS